MSQSFLYHVERLRGRIGVGLEGQGRKSRVGGQQMHVDSISADSVAICTVNPRKNRRVLFYREESTAVVFFFLKLKNVRHERSYTQPW